MERVSSSNSFEPGIREIVAGSVHRDQAPGGVRENLQGETQGTGAGPPISQQASANPNQPVLKPKT